ncbi:hypothetical protein [Hymenobacter coccineus]|uniref:Uncharacterized protein n=1 Tax=Hymenobacter coccineus TaxID=1908235 RepID=A0A1G1TBQ6_9BACT|nr:hypothetical protein [Hymenobacter coccineus]OGX88299.1 hypothetical protein BEN49_10265 [Hymenobacter coccineus]
MKTPALFPLVARAARRTGLTAWQTGRLFRQLAARALDAVQDVLRAEVEKGNLKLVADFLSNKAVPAARVLLLERMSVRLLARLGLRGALASNVVGWVLPFVLEKLVVVALKSGLLDKLKANPTVGEALGRLDELRLAAWHVLVPDPGSGAELVAGEAPAPLPGPTGGGPA